VSCATAVPARIAKRIAAWGGAGFAERMAGAWLNFMEIAPKIAVIDKRKGAQAALEVYHEVIAGRADAKMGIVIEPL
jgi:hypothetical protein